MKPFFIIALMLFSYWAWKSSFYVAEDYCSLSSAATQPLEENPGPCQSEIESHPMTSKRRHELGRSWYSFKTKKLTRLGDLSSTQSLYLEQLEYSMHLDNGYQTVVVSQVVTMEHPDCGCQLEEIDWEPFRQISQNAVDFVIQVYRERRPHWTEEFYEKLKKIAIEELENSIYITVHEGTLNIEERPIRGTIRLIKERNGLVPAERTLGIRVETGGALKVEPGNLALDKQFREEAWPQLVLFLRHPLLNDLGIFDKVMFITYADYQSFKMYSKLNYSPIPEEDWQTLTGLKLPESREGRILKHGVEWTPMMATQEKIESIYSDFIEQQKKRRREEAAKSAQEQKKEMLEKSNEFSQIQFVGRLGDGQKAILKVMDYQTHYSLMLNRGGNNVTNLLTIPKKYIPLNGTELHTQERGVELSYSNGLLTVKRSEFDRVTEINCSLDLQFVTRVVTYQEGKILYDIKF